MSGEKNERKWPGSEDLQTMRTRLREFILSNKIRVNEMGLVFHPEEHVSVTLVDRGAGEKEKELILKEFPSRVVVKIIPPEKAVTGFNFK